MSAAASLKTGVHRLRQAVPDASARFSFAGSDELAAQIEQGVKPDVFAAANTKLPDELYAKGLVEKPTVFAGNRLVLAVPADGAEGRARSRTSRPKGVKLAIGAKDVPVGDLHAHGARQAARRSSARRSSPTCAPRSPTSAGITGKLTQGAVDAGFLYASDVRATDDKLKAIELPDELQPTVAYGVAVVKGAKHPKQAKAFIAGLLDGDGAQALEDAGFLPPPTQ